MPELHGLRTPAKTLPAFTPLLPRSNRQRSISPPPDIDSGINNTPLPASSGMFLLIRNVLPTDKSGFGKPVDLVKKAIDQVCNSDETNLLSTITLSVVAGGRPQDPYSSSAYIDLAQEIKALDHLPRPDLLTSWMIALTKCRPAWEIVWAPQKKGKDRRMIVRFRVADSKEKVPMAATDKLRAHLESKGHKTTGGYISFNGLVDITFADTSSVDTVLASSYYLVPSLSKEGMHVSAPKFIPIEDPFELCIGGISEYEGIHDIIEKWLYHSYAYEDTQKSTRVHHTRMSTDMDYFIFTMDSWDSTILVLKNTEAFRTYFTRSPLLTDPKLVFELNSSGFARKSFTSVIDAGAGLVNDAITEMKRELTDLRKEQAENHKYVEHRFSSMHVAIEKQTNVITQMESQISQSALSLLAGRDEKAIECKISAIDNSILAEMLWLRFATELEERQALKQSILRLQAERRDLAASLADASATTIRLIGPAPGTNFARHATAVDQEPATPSTATEPATPCSVPHTPIRNTQTPSHVLSNSRLPSESPHYHLTPTIPVFDLSSVSTPTPAPRTSTSTATKRPQQASNTLDTSAKRPKQYPAQRTNTTRSESRGTHVSHPSNDEVTDIFNQDSVLMAPPVRPHFASSPYLLITVPADQGDYPVAGSRPFITHSVIRNSFTYKPVYRDQLGCVSTTNRLLSSEPCICYRKKITSQFLLWVLLALTFVCMILPAAAAPSAAASLSLYALNTNGFVHPMKIDATNRAISHRNPDIVVITETKTNSARGSKMSYNDYQFFEERGTPVVGHHLFKWGVILGIKKGITVSQRVPISHPALAGRIVAVDIVIPLDSGSGFTHRIIAAYAPWDVTNSSDAAAFWTEATKICTTATSSWTLLGDLNATVTQAERKSGGSDARSHFNSFLRHSNGFDLWSNYPERSIRKFGEVRFSNMSFMNPSQYYIT